MDGQQQQHDACTTTPSRPPRPPTPAMTMDDADLDNSWQPKRHPPFVIGVAGGTASGKTTVCDRIMQRLNDKSVVLISQDAFYRPLTEPEREAAKGNSYNFDHPDAFDNALLLECLRALAEGRAFDCPTYDFATHSRTSETRRIEPADVIVLEGILVLAVPAVREACSLRVYVDTDDDVRLARRIQRDVAVRGRDVAGVIAQYQRFVKPCFDTFVSPSRRFADVIVPWHDGGGPGGGLGAAGWLGGLGGEAATADGASFAATAGDRASAGGAATTGGASCGNNSNEGGNIVAIDLIEQHIRSKLQQHPLRRLFPTLSLIPPSFQLVGMLTILRDATTPKDQFVFYADRVIRLVVEAGLGHLPFTEKEVRTPTSRRYVGVEFCKGICGVSIIRSGEAMESALRSCARGVKIGKLLIARTRHCGRLEELAAPSAAPSPAPVGAGAAASGRPPRLPSAQGALLPSAPATTSTRAMSLSCDDAGSPTSAPQGLVRLQSAHGPPPTAANGANGNGSGSGNALNGGNLVIYEKLPRDIAERHVLLMDPVLTTGHTATKAVETLLARGVKEERIVLLSILASPAGVARLCGAHPRLRLVTAEIDEGVDERWQLVPGMGEFGQRYYS